MPQALISGSNVATVGDINLRSMREIVGWAVPVRRANSRWDRPARRRAMFSILAASILFR
jgi:hypothetical protein